MKTNCTLQTIQLCYIVFFVQHVANKIMKTLDSFLLQKCVNLSLLIQHYKTIAEKMFSKTFCCLVPFDLLHLYNAVKFRVQVGQQPFQ